MRLNESRGKNFPNGRYASPFIAEDHDLNKEKRK